MSNHTSWLRRLGHGVWLTIAAAILIAVLPGSSRAAEGSGFNIQVSPSPLVVTLNPGERQTANVTIRNLSNHPETLVPRLSGFVIDRTSEKIELQSGVPQGLSQWISFTEPTLAIPAGGSKVLTVAYNTPSNVGFSYALAITLSPKDRQPTPGSANLQGAVAVFNLININRPDAKRQLAIANFAANKSRYEFLPATFSLTLKNQGNVIDQPTGNIFIQRTFNDNEPLATIPINKGAAYILPDTSRTFTASWEAGFPRYVTNTAAQGTPAKHLSWEWRNLGDLRFGRYVAKAVLVYNDGQRDVPLVASYSFWVIPWRLLLATLVVSGLIVTGLIAWGRLIFKGTNRVRKYAARK